jgi:hypothetical protein
MDTVLLEILRLERLHASTPRPAGIGIAYGAEKLAWQHVGQFGPKVADVFGPKSDTERMRLSRRLKVLEAKGLVELSRVAGVYVTHVRLTPEGRRIAGG